MMAYTNSVQNPEYWRSYIPEMNSNRLKKASYMKKTFQTSYTHFQTQLFCNQEPQMILSTIIMESN